MNVIIEEHKSTLFMEIGVISKNHLVKCIPMQSLVQTGSGCFAIIEIMGNPNYVVEMIAKVT